MLLNIAGAVAGYYVATKQGGKKTSTAMKAVGAIVGWVVGGFASTIVNKATSTAAQTPAASFPPLIQEGPTLPSDAANISLDQTRRKAVVYQLAPQGSSNPVSEATTTQVRRSR